MQIETQADKIAALEAERDKDNAAQAGFIDSLGELAGRIESQAETAAALLAHVGDLTAKVQALEAAKPAA